MKKFLNTLFAILVMLSIVLQATAPTIAFAADYKDNLKHCTNGGKDFYVPKGTTCPDPADWLFFGCMVAASVLAIGASALLWWNPPLALVVFGTIFVGAANVCPHLPPPPPPPPPNLITTNVMLTSASIAEEGSSVRFKGKVTNNGGVSTSLKFNNRFDYRWDTTGSWIHMAKIEMVPVDVGVAVTETSDFLMLNRQGTLQVRLCTDVDNVIDESTNSDNCSGYKNPVSITVGPATASPDLKPQAITVVGTPVIGQQIKFTSGVKNEGTANSLLNTVARFCVDNATCGAGGGPSLGDINLPILIAGITSSFTSNNWTVTASPNPHTVYFCVSGTCTMSTFSNSGDCKVNGFNVLNHNPITLYSKDIVAYNQLCSSYAQTSTCTDGVMSSPPIDSSHTFGNCTTGAAPTQTDISLTPSSDLVRKGSSITLTWNAGNAEACTLTGTNGFPTKTGFNGTGNVSTVINEKTTFTFRCTLATSSKQVITTINLIPQVQEI